MPRPPITGRRGLEARENSLRCEMTSTRPCAEARDRNTALGRLGPRIHQEGLFVRSRRRPHGSLQASGQARTTGKARQGNLKRLGEPKNKSKTIEARACRASVSSLVSCSGLSGRKCLEEEEDKSAKDTTQLPIRETRHIPLPPSSGGSGSRTDRKSCGVVWRSMRPCDPNLFKTLGVMRVFMILAVD
jgi:hypothetical protein